MNDLLSNDLVVRFLASGPVARAVVSATLLIGVAGLAAALAQRASASVRHTIWFTALGASLFAAVLSATGPLVEIRAETVANGPGVVPFDREIFTAQPDPERAPRPTPTPTPTVARPAEPGIATWLYRHAITFAAILWIAGVIVVVARFMTGQVRVARVLARSSAASPEIVAVAARAARLAGAEGSFQVRMSADIETPCTVGSWRPVVLLPAGAASWTGERLGIVLVHELGHVARLDYAAQVVAIAACAVHWFNPFVWFAAAQLRAEAEQAADDRVLAAGVDGVTYASHLLELARAWAPAPMATVVVGMARTTHLERRFQAMLDTTRARGIVPLRWQAAAGTAVMAVAVPLAGLQVIPVAAAPQVPAVTVATAALSPVAAAVASVAPVTSTPAIEAPARSIAPRALAPLATVGAVAPAADSIVDKTLSARAGEAISIDLDMGGDIVVQSWDQPQVRARVTLSGDQSHETSVDFERAGAGLELRARPMRRRNNARNSNTVELWVPRQFDVHVQSAGGAIRVTGVEGHFTGRTGGGAIILQDVKGEASLTTGGGEVLVSDSRLDGTVTTGGGKAIVASVTGNVRVSSGSGPVVRGGTAVREIGVGGNATGRRPLIVIDGVTVDDPTSITSAGGDHRFESLPLGGVVRTGGGDIYIGSSRGSLDATTGGGRIELAAVGGDAKATTGAGEVTISVVNTDGTEHSIEVHSGSGRVILELPASIDARFDIETAYTERHGATKVQSDFPVEVNETTEWDGRNGTPRRYVRATGTSGSGRGLIRVRTVNGDVVIRRK
jgi:beta-lactamase regulating signal transducer with metallopeptidase domain/DUF4097 and DUF4098 domain-containing protein YvlB